MFTADLSWTDPDTEKVGERRERKAREKGQERSPSSGSPSINSLKSSVPDDRELWWPSSLKKARSLIPSHKTRTETNQSTKHPRFGSISLPRPLEIDTSDIVRDPKLQPAWTYTTSLSPTLPSGAPLEPPPLAPPEYEVPELEGEMSSRGTDSSGSRSSHERRRGWMSPAKAPARIRIMNEVNEVQQLSPQSYVARTTRLSSEEAVPAEPRGESSSSNDKKKKKKPYSVRIEGRLDVEALRLQDQMLRQQHPEEYGPPAPEKKPSYASGLPNSDVVAWRPPSEWDIMFRKSQELSLSAENDLQEEPSVTAQGDIAVAPGSPADLTRFQRFIRRMESAGPKVILDRVKEEWSDHMDPEAGEEMVLEKQLWVLTAFQLENLGRYSRFPTSNTGKILELYGNISEVYQLSAMYPRHQVHYLTEKPQSTVSMPQNVSCLTVPQPGLLPLPYPDSCFSHIRASTLPSIVPSSKLPELFQECYRILAPGGMLEIRIMDAAPVRKTAGPKMKAWIEDRLSTNLERMFRCSKPCTLVPGWVSDAGFDLPATLPSEGEETVKLRCASDPNSSDVNAELSMLVGRALWKDIWGGFADEVQDEPHWWWEDEEVVAECLERETVFECGAIFAFKN